MSTRQYHLDDDEIRRLGDKLERVAGDCLELEMTIAIDGSGRTITPGPVVHTAPGSRAPYPLGMAELIDTLRSELSTTIRHLEEHRAVVYGGTARITDMASWLKDKRFHIALLLDADEVAHALITIIDRCLRALNLITQEYVINQALIEEANRLWYTADQLAKLAPKIGEEGLSRTRIHTLVRKHGLKGYRDSDSGITRYRLGDVLTRHRSAPRRAGAKIRMS